MDEGAPVSGLGAALEHPQGLIEGAASAPSSAVVTSGAASRACGCDAAKKGGWRSQPEPAHAGRLASTPLPVAFFVA